jgi:hypothetical protein
MYGRRHSTKKRRAVSTSVKCPDFSQQVGWQKICLLNGKSVLIQNNKVFFSIHVQKKMVVTKNFVEKFDFTKRC